MVACAVWLGKDVASCTRGEGCICRRESVAAWLQERMENCVRIADTKLGADKAGWVEDACFFKAAILLVSKDQ